MVERKIGPNRGNAGKGRPKGAKNKTTKAIKEMITEALEEAGGVDYLVTQAKESPAAFLALVGKVLPMQLNANVVGELSLVERRIVRPAD